MQDLYLANWHCELMICSQRRIIDKTTRFVSCHSPIGNNRGFVEAKKRRKHRILSGLFVENSIEFYPGFLSKIQNSRVFIFFKLVSFEFWILRDNWINILMIFFHQMRYIRTTKKKTPYLKRHLALSSVERMDIKQIERCLNYFY